MIEGAFYKALDWFVVLSLVAFVRFAGVGVVFVVVVFVVVH